MYTPNISSIHQFIMALKLTTALLLLLLFLGLFKVSHALAANIFCLKAIKASLDDPYRYLSSWNFNNNTEGFICKFTGVECWHADENKVLNIRLSGMGLKGSFPNVVKNCTSLTGLDLSYNNLYGTIPSDIYYLLPYVTSLDLSGNNFSGEIPKSLGNCTYLNVLMLDNNRFTGNLPRELGWLSRLNQFNVSNNPLSGPVPDFEKTYVKNDSYVNNMQLCGGPLEPCLHKESDDSFRSGFEVGYYISAVVVFISFSFSWPQLKNVMKIMLLYMVHNIIMRRKKADQVLLHLPTLKNKNEISQLEKLVNRMSFLEICKATDNFKEDNVIGEGKTGTMYKATLLNGWFLAVKKLSDSPQFESQYVSELLALSKIRHDNLVPLLGFCMENNERLLVYKYMSNGNLHDCLHPPRGEAAKILEWPLRIKIAMGIAKGLAWLHHKCIFRVVHRNISSRSILLDRYFEPKISNFGLAIISNHGGAMFVYPNENESGLFVDSGVWESDFVKKDVYDYGILLLELITGKETITSSTSSSGLHNTLVEWIDHLSFNSCLLNDAIDKPLIGQGYEGQILQVLEIASDCVHPFPYKRPSLLEVYKRLSHIGDRYGIPCDFGMLLQPRRS